MISLADTFSVTHSLNLKQKWCLSDLRSESLHFSCEIRRFRAKVENWPRTDAILVDFGPKKSENVPTLHFQWCFRLRRRLQWYVAWIRNTKELFPTSDADPPIFRSESTGFQQNFMICTPQVRFWSTLPRKGRRFLNFSIFVGDLTCGHVFCDT